VWTNGLKQRIVRFERPVDEDEVGALRHPGQILRQRLPFTHGARLLAAAARTGLGGHTPLEEGQKALDDHQPFLGQKGYGIAGGDQPVKSGLATLQNGGVYVAQIDRPHLLLH
jgi:hypothetical protein